MRHSPVNIVGRATVGYKGNIRLTDTKSVLYNVHCFITFILVYVVYICIYLYIYVYICSIFEAKMELGGRIAKRYKKYRLSILQGGKKGYRTVSKLYNPACREMKRSLSLHVHCT